MPCIVKIRLQNFLCEVDFRSQCAMQWSMWLLRKNSISGALSVFKDVRRFCSPFVRKYQDEKKVISQHRHGFKNAAGK